MRRLIRAPSRACINFGAKNCSGFPQLGDHLVQVSESIIPHNAEEFICRRLSRDEAKEFFIRKSRYHGSQILAILEQNESGPSVPDLCREHGMASAMFYKRRAKVGGMKACMMKRLKELAAENAGPKNMYAEERLKAEIRQEALEEKL